ncbi:MAG: hypothetical protein IOMNBAOH_02121 [Rhodocyclaceae bacterium]|nr:hypothetical protein [Rhodocyclaceae bacterium]
MKRFIAALSMMILSTGVLLSGEAEAKRLGGGSSAGMQRSLPAKPAPTAVPAKPQPASPAAAPDARPKRSWLGPIAGLAAGLGIAALMSHLGLGTEFGNILTLALLALAVVFGVRWLLRRANPSSRPAEAIQGAGLAGAGPTERGAPTQRVGHEVQWGGSTAGAPLAATQVTDAQVTNAKLPSDFDADGFARIAKMIFIRMQAANDTGDLADLRAFTTPEMFASIKLDLQERASGAQQTDVVKIDAEVLEFTHESDRDIVSVRFHGLIRENDASGVMPFDEAWHLVRPTDGGPQWLIAGIQQMA